MEITEKPTYEVVCKDCGEKYISLKNANGYCETCRSLHMQATRRRYYDKRKQNKAEVRSTLAKCSKCGGVFAPANSAQILCEKCQFLRESGYKMSASNLYRKEHTDCIQFKVKKGVRAELKEYACKHDMTLTDLIIEGIEFAKAYHSMPADKQAAINSIINSL